MLVVPCANCGKLVRRLYPCVKVNHCGSSFEFSRWRPHQARLAFGLGNAECACDRGLALYDCFFLFFVKLSAALCLLELQVASRLLERGRRCSNSRLFNLVRSFVREGARSLDNLSFRSDSRRQCMAFGVPLFWFV